MVAVLFVKDARIFGTTKSLSEGNKMKKKKETKETVMVPLRVFKMQFFSFPGLESSGVCVWCMTAKKLLHKWRGIHLGHV